MALVLSIDVGTTNIKAGVVDQNGALLDSSQFKLSILRPEARAAEHDPEALFQAISTLCKEVTTPYKDAIQTVVLSTYQFGLILLDAEKKPLTGLTTLLDTRARVTFDAFKKTYSHTDVYARTGCPPFTQYPLARLFYFSRKNPELLKQTAYILSSKAYLLYRLTGQFITDPSTEAASQMMHIAGVSWDPEILAPLGLSTTQFPRIVDALKEHFPLLPAISATLGVNKKATIIPGLYDGGALAVGLGGLQEDTGVINIGTSGMLRVLTRTPVLDTPERMGIQTYYLMDGLYFAGGAVNNATVPLNWLSEHLTLATYEDCMKAARTAPIGSRKVFFLPYFTGERDWEIGTVASASLFGLREFHTRADIFRSALEGVAYSLNTIKIALSEAGIPIQRVTIGGGGVRDPLWCEILANVLNIPLQKSDSEIACLIGNGILGLVAQGLYPDIQAASKRMVTPGAVFEPSQDSVADYTRYYHFYMKLCSGFKELYYEHAQLARE